jgi:superfamily II DNA or RNA helicase
MEIKLRDYQRNGANELYTKLKTNDSVLFQLATGGGKTFIFSFFVKHWIGANKGNTLILVHRKELMDQTVNSLKKLGVEAEKIDRKNTKPKHNCRVYVSMAQTLIRRLRKNANYLPNIGLMIVDEAHRNDFNNIFDYFTNYKRVGFSATPISANKKHPLKNIYQDIVCCAGISNLIKEGNLTNNKTYTINIGIDKSKFKKFKGDYSVASQLDQYKLPKMIDNTIKAYETKCLGKKTIIFNVNIEHSNTVCSGLIANGYPAKSLDSKCTTQEREEALKWLKETPNAILCNVDILTTGFDEPSVECIVVNRSTTSLPLWLQMTGRGGRLYPGKEFFTIVDLGMNATRHGDWSDPRDWKVLFFQDQKQGEGVAPVKDCPECGFLNHTTAKVCGECEYEFPVQVVEEDSVFDLVLLEKYKTGIDVVDKYKEMIMQGYKPHKAVHEIQNELLKSLRYIRAPKFEANKDKIINDLQKAFYPKYKELHEHDKNTFKLHPKNLRYWYDQFLPKLNKRFGTNL